MIAKSLLDLLACPACDERPPVALFENQWLHCQRCDRFYPIQDNMPNMLIEEACIGRPTPKPEAKEAQQA